MRSARSVATIPSVPALLASALCVWIFIGCGLAAAQFQFPAPEGDAARSRSGQFIIYGANIPGLFAPALDLGTNVNLIRLQPALLTVSCERIKEMLWHELGATAPWRGKIYITVFAAQTADDTITVTAGRFKDGWQYRLDLPDVIERTRLVRVLVQALLLELANRNAGERSAEIPLWLSEGLTRQLLASSVPELVVRPPRGTVNGLNLSAALVNARKDNPLEKAHEQLRANPPLTFEELSWPTAEALVGEAAESYRSSAQLFVSELLRLKQGRACLRGMLAELPQHYNWQFAFLHAFRAYFPRQLEVEKWWALQLVHFTGRDLGQTWPLWESWQKLDQTLHAAVQVRPGTNDLPLHAAAPLQTIIREWDAARQTVAVQEKARELEWLRLRVAPELVGLVDEYRRTLEKYLQDREKTNSKLARRRAVTQRRPTEEALKRLDALDAQREALRPAASPS
ncbi:MAG: hypothetical protein DME25_02995 [Verrucomicrobia bacterium]|nr:MAG: hypothetical protein DME25_02995 [Verrucomicrobiota bacterium]